MPVYMHILLSFTGCLGFGVLFNVKKENLFFSAVTGAAAWSLVTIFDSSPQINYVFANTLAALMVGIFSELFAMLKKTPATVFMVIGIIPLVPGFRVYRSMLFFLHNKIQSGVAEGVQACFIAIAIAVGIILSTSCTRLIKRGLTAKK